MADTNAKGGNPENITNRVTVFTFHPRLRFVRYGTIVSSIQLDLTKRAKFPCVFGRQGRRPNRILLMTDFLALGRIARGQSASR